MSIPIQQRSSTREHGDDRDADQEVAEAMGSEEFRRVFRESIEDIVQGRTTPLEEYLRETGGRKRRAPEPALADTKW